MSRGEVIPRKRDVYGNPIGCENANPILDSRRYKVEFEDGEVTEITVNAITECTYAKCDENGNDLLLLNYLIDSWKSERAMSLQDHQITVNRRSCKKLSTAGWEIFVIWKD